MAAPLYTADEVRRVLELPEDWEPQAFIALGRRRADYRPFDRPSPDLGGSLIER